MSGLLERLTTDILGPPTQVITKDWPEMIWGAGKDIDTSVLYKGIKWTSTVQDRMGLLRTIYGDARGAFLFGGCLRLALLDGPEEFGMYQIESLQAQPAISKATHTDPGIFFFMESANICFYGVKDDSLFVYDTALDELERLGPLEFEMEKLFLQWVAASR